MWQRQLYYSWLLMVLATNASRCKMQWFVLLTSNKPFHSPHHACHTICAKTDAHIPGQTVLSWIVISYPEYFFSRSMAFHFFAEEKSLFDGVTINISDICQKLGNPTYVSRFIYLLTCSFSVKCCSLSSDMSSILLLILLSDDGTLDTLRHLDPAWHLQLFCKPGGWVSALQ